VKLALVQIMRRLKFFNRFLKIALAAFLQIKFLHLQQPAAQNVGGHDKRVKVECAIKTLFYGLDRFCACHFAQVRIGKGPYIQA